MKRYFFAFTALLVFFPVFIIAKEIPLNLAKRVAKNFYYEKINQIHEASLSSLKITAIFTKTAGNSNVYYIFNINTDAYVIVSADDRVWPVLAYSFSCSYDEKNPSPEFTSWMQDYAEQITYAVSNNLAPSEEINMEWSRLLTDDIGSLNIAKTLGVEPLLTSTWNQDKYYNEQCPEDENGNGGHALTGCVATAFAQILYYYRFPLQGTGSHGYLANYGNWGYGDYGYLFVNFGNATYQWEEMVDEIGYKSNNAIAQLMFHCGVAVDMMYGPYASGAYSGNVVTALTNYFGYSSLAQLKSKNSYSNTQWANMLKTNLDNNMPLYYHGYSSGSGHAFVCDGYQGSDYFHFNWGWGGAYDGYFYLNNLNPGSNFSNGQGAIFNIYPASNYPYYCSGNKTISASRGTITDGSGPENYQANSSCSWLIAPNDSIDGINLKFKKFNTEQNVDLVTVYDGGNTSAPVIGTFSGNNLPSVISSTSMQMLVTFTTSSSVNAPGWFAEYEAINPVYCTNNTILTDPTGVITDGSGSYNYNDMTICNWKIQPANMTFINLSFDYFDTELNNDLVKIYNTSTNPSTLLATYSGNTIPPPVSCNCSSMLVVFFSNNSNTAGGWSATYTSGYADVEENILNDNISVFPNPSDGLIFITASSAFTEKTMIEVYAPEGKLIYRNEIQKGLPPDEFVIDLSSCAKGIYFLGISNTSGKIHQKIILN